MKKTGIISAMWVEAKLLAEAMDNVKITEYNGMKFYDGLLCGHSVILSTCGVGKLNAAIYTQLMIDRFNIGRLIHTGIAGSLDSSAGHLDVVIANCLTYHDVRKSQMTDLFPYQEYFKTDENLHGLLLQCAEEKGNSKVHDGMILTGDAFVTSREQKENLKKRFPQALCVDMESCAVAHTAYVNQIPTGILRCISDLADGDAHGDYATFEQKAADKAAEIVIKAVCKV